MSSLIINGIKVEIIRKRIKNLNLRVLPPEGQVVVSVPSGMSIESAEKFISSKQDWIKKQQERLAGRIHDLEKNFSSGEKIFLFGTEYHLELVSTVKKEGVALKDGRIILYTRDREDRDRKEKLMDAWYRKNLEQNIPDLISKWEKIIGVVVNEFRIRKMTTRWGTCNPGAKRIWISLMLARRRPELLEYIVVHEMIHLLERGHNKRFYGYMDQYLPGWKDLRKELK